VDFNFTDEQRLLSESVQRFVREQYTFEKRRAYLHAESNKSVWNALAELGLTAINVEESHGGLGGGAVETMLTMNALGEGLVLEPYVEGAVLAPTLLSSFESQTAAELLPLIATGERLVVLAHEEPQSRDSLAHVQSRAIRRSNQYVLDGYKSVIGYGARADDLLVSARLTGDVTDERHVGLFRVDPRADGVRVIGYRTLDGRLAADVELKDVRIDASQCLSEDAFMQIEAAYDVGLSALCAEAVGIMNAVNATTLEYLKNRKQFGQPIGRFQALQHRMADMYIHAEQATSMSYLAAVRCTDPDRMQRRKALSAAKVLIGQAGKFIAHQSIQLHGGMGMTDEMLVSHYFKRLTAIEFTLGDSDTHLRQVIAAW
jgi:alkylation response protein AidB-like acyl-CoA dehydrogenase